MREGAWGSWRRALGALVCVVVAAAGYLGATGLLESLYAYRSPLPATIGPQAAETGVPDTPATPRLARRVVAVLVDGLRVDTADDPAVMPYLAELRARGVSTRMQVGTPSYSVPGWTVLMTGAWIELHGGLAMNPPEVASAPAWVQDNVFTAARDAGLRTGIAGTDWFTPLIPRDALSTSFFVHEETDAADQASTDAARRMLDGDTVDLLLVHLNEVDHAGHYSGGGTSAAWRTAASKADARLRAIAGSLDLSRDALVVFSDHGHLDQGGHGGPEDIVTISPLVMAGAGVRTGMSLPTAQQVDLAQTITALLGLRLPRSGQGGALTGGLTLDEPALTTLRAAQTAQQRDLLGRYAAALGVPVETASGDVAAGPVAAGQAAVDDLRQDRLSADRSARAPLVGGVAVLLALLMAVFAWRRPRRFGWALAGAAAYWLVAHGFYRLVQGRTYSMSSVTSATDVILALALTTALGLAAAWLVTAAGRWRRDGSGARPGSALTPIGDSLLLVGATLAVPILVGAWLGGWTVGRILPDALPMFLQFSALLQLLVVATLSLLVGLVVVLVAAARGRRRPA